MKHYIRTLITGILGLIGGSIGYFKDIPFIIQISITISAALCITLMAIYDRKKQLENDKKILIDRMRNHLNNDYRTINPIKKSQWKLKDLIGILWIRIKL
jgi:hypothetical protein